MEVTEHGIELKKERVKNADVCKKIVCDISEDIV